MICVGIDASLTGTAVCFGESINHFSHRVFTGTEEQCLACPVARRMDRIDQIVVPIEKMLVSHEVAVIAIEGYSMGSKFNREILAELGAILRSTLIEYAPIYEIAPMTLKKWVTGTGKGDKTKLIASITKEFGHVFDTNDEYDAFGLFHIALHLSGQMQPTTKYREQTIKTVLEK